MRTPLRPLFCGFLLLFPLALALPAPAAHAQAMRPADPAPVGKTVHFTLDKTEQKDLAITLAPGSYYLQADIKRVDDKNSNIIAAIDFLKSNGAVVQSNVLTANEVHPVARVATTFTVAKPLAARLRVKNEDAAKEFWITVMPQAKKTFMPFSFAHGDLKPLGIGAANGKGGSLGESEYAFHTIKLPAGKYNVSLYMKQADGKSTNLMGQLLLLDVYGVTSKSPAYLLNVNAVDVETRQEQRLVLIKPQTVLFRVTNTNNKPIEYTIDIEKATD